MADYIDREAAIDAVAKWLSSVFGVGEMDGTATVFKKIRSIPAADVVTWEQLCAVWKIATAGEPQTRRGHWIEDNIVSECRCSECGHKWSYFDNDTDTFNYCPHCGALMVGEVTP